MKTKEMYSITAHHTASWPRAGGWSPMGAAFESGDPVHPCKDRSRTKPAVLNVEVISI